MNPPTTIQTKAASYRRRPKRHCCPCFPNSSTGAFRLIRSPAFFTNRLPRSAGELSPHTGLKEKRRPTRNCKSSSNRRFISIWLSDWRPAKQQTGRKWCAAPCHCSTPITSPYTSRAESLLWLSSHLVIRLYLSLAHPSLADFKARIRQGRV